MGGTQKTWAVFGYALLPFLQNFSWACVQIDSVNIPAIFEVLALAVPEIIAIVVLG